MPPQEPEGAYKWGACPKRKGGDAPKIQDGFHRKEKGTCYACHLRKGRREEDGV